MNNLDKVIKGPEQMSALFWQTASEIMLDNQELLKVKTSVDGEERFLVTPECQPLNDPSYNNHRDRNGWNRFRTNPLATPDDQMEKEILSHSFSIAAQTNSKGKYKPGMPLYMIVDGQVTSPLLKFDSMTQRLQVLDGGFGSVDDSDEVIGKILGYIEEDLTNRRLSHESNTGRKKVKTALVSAAIIGLASIGGGIFGFFEWRESLADQKAEDRQEFDERNIRLDSEVIEVGQIAFTNTVSQDLMNEIPMMDKSEGYDLSSPRKINIDEGECKTISVIDVETDTVRAVSGIEEDLTTVGVTETGKLIACALDLDINSSEETIDEYEIAVQVLRQS